MSDKVFTKKMTLSICLIILCLCALSISAGAFFSDTAKTGAKTFSTATYDLTIAATKQVTTVTDNTIDPPATSIATETVAPDTADPHIYTLDILPEPDKDEGYSVKVSIKEGITATSSGYCKIVITDKADTSITYGTYYTKQIAIAEHPSADIKTFRQMKIKTEKDIVVTFIPLWGTYSGVNGSALADNAVISVSATGDVTVA